MKNLIPYIFILIPCLFSACATTQKTGTTQTQVNSPVLVEKQNEQASTGSMLLHESDLQPFANRVQWPEKPASDDSQPAYTIESGVEEGVWLEGKGYFKGSLKDILKTLTNPKIMGPTYLTDDIVVNEYRESDVLTTFVMHVKMRYIMTVEFDLSVSIEAIYDSEDNIVGYRYYSTKQSGTKFITRIEENIIAKKLNDSWFSVEFQSLNEATMNKEKETRKHLETLFSYWSGE